MVFISIKGDCEVQIVGVYVHNVVLAYFTMFYSKCYLSLRAGIWNFTKNGEVVLVLDGGLGALSYIFWGVFSLAGSTRALVTLTTV
jgi:hypothetical protein